MNNRFSVLILLFILIISQGSIFAQGNLMIMPKRLVFDGTQRSQEVTLSNSGKDSASYAISFIQYKMNEDGSFQQVSKDEMDYRFADDFLRYYPRKVSLGPNESQTVRLQLTRTGNMTDGEYRSHLYFRAVEDEEALGSNNGDNNSAGISIQIKTVFGISIPIIIRKGESSTTLKISNVSLDTTTEKPMLSLELERFGNMSVYGNLKVIHQSNSGKEKDIGEVKGIAVYTPINLRQFSFSPQNAEDVDLSEGSLKIIYQTEDEEILASREFEIK